MIHCCNDTHQGAPHTGKQTCACALDLDDASHITCLNSNAKHTLITVYICKFIFVCAAALQTKLLWGRYDDVS